MMLEPERAAALVAERLRRSLRGEPGAGVTSATADEPEALAHGGRDWLVRRTLEELGIHCEATGTLQDLKGFLVASRRGAEIVLSDKLDEDERLGVYAHLLAHALLEELEGKSGEARSFFSRLEYVEGREPEHRTSAERREERVADALARAILRGRLDGAPEYTYRRGERPKRLLGALATGLRGPGSVTSLSRLLRLRPAFGRLVLDVCHRFSLALFWHSPKYQRLRSRQEMTFLVRRVQDLVRVAYAC